MKAEKLLRKAERLNIEDDPYLMLHQAELDIHNNEFESASTILTQAERIVSRSKTSDSASSRFASQLIAIHGSTASVESQNSIERRRADAFVRLRVNIACLRAVTSFRMAPSEPEGALFILQQAQQEIDLLSQSRSAKLFLELSLGEIACQAGDIVAGLGHFKQASICDPSHPLPYTNAARAYQQLQQWSLAEHHLKMSLSYDPHLAMTYVDIAQGRSLTGRVDSALQLLDAALPYARHVSEIRDVLAARTVTAILLELQHAGIYAPPSNSFPWR